MCAVNHFWQLIVLCSFNIQNWVTYTKETKIRLQVLMQIIRAVYQGANKEKNTFEKNSARLSSVVNEPNNEMNK